MENNRKRQKDFENVDGERSQRKVRKNQTKIKTTVAMTNLTPDDRCAKRSTTEQVDKPLPVMLVTMTHDMEMRTLHVSFFWLQ